VTESAIQALIVRWLDAALPAGSILHHSPNEGQRHVNFKLKLGRAGTQWGWPDIELFAPPAAFISTTQWAPVFLEVKTAKGRMTENQKAVHQALRECCCQVATVRSIEDVESFLSPLLHLRTTGRANLLRQLCEASA